MKLLIFIASLLSASLSAADIKYDREITQSEGGKFNTTSIVSGAEKPKGSHTFVLGNGWGGFSRGFQLSDLQKLDNKSVFTLYDRYVIVRFAYESFDLSDNMFYRMQVIPSDVLLDLALGSEEFLQDVSSAISEYAGYEQAIILKD